MAITTYSELVTAVSNWMARSDLSARIPEFIALAEAKLNRKLFVRQMEQRATSTVDTESDEPEHITLPSDFQSMKRIRLSGVDGKPKLTYLTNEQFDDKDTGVYGGRTGRPMYFTVVGSELVLLPTPDDAYELEMIYRRNVPALTASNTTNWLLTFAPDIYLYGALREAGMYMQEDERVPLWNSGFEAALEELNQQARTHVSAGSNLSMRIAGATP